MRARLLRSGHGDLRMTDYVLDRLVETGNTFTPNSAAQLKTIQEVIALVVFYIFSVVYLKEELKWNYLAGFAMMIGTVFVIFKEW